jgi:hypothetical protein
VNGSCTIAACNAGYANCDNIVSTGCEVPTASDPNNCGGCGVHCNLQHANSTCVSSACAISSCLAPYVNCNNIASDGCEVDPTADNNHCGTCSKICPSGSNCLSSACTIDYGNYTMLTCYAPRDPFGANYLLGSTLTIGATITVTKLGLFTTASAVGPHFQLALYKDNAGAPGALVAFTPSTALAQGQNEIPVTAPTAVAPGTYWLMGVYDVGAQICADAITTNKIDYISLTYGTALPNPFPASPTTYMGGNINYYVVGTE